ncbi:hypothetical protein BJY52DRAFT_1229270 [Lactarius psammicola]|nr:hypothetical protein BJY52DRAFT_1229270 [Lactarius psammicola]
MDLMVIKVVVKKDWLVDVNLIMPSVERRKIENIMKIEFMEKEKKEIGKNNLWQKKLKKVKKQVEKKKAQGGEEDQELDGLKRAAKQLEEEFKMANRGMEEEVRLMMRAETIKVNKRELSMVIYWFLLRNEIKDTYMDFQICYCSKDISYLRADAYEIDLAKRGDHARNLDVAVLYPMFINKVKDKVALFKDLRASSEFLVESLEVLKWVVNPNKPPMVLSTIEPLVTKLLGMSSNITAIMQELSYMAEAFKGKGDSSTWIQDLLKKINQCFLNNYYDAKVLCNLIFFQRT